MRIDGKALGQFSVPFRPIFFGLGAAIYRFMNDFLVNATYASPLNGLMRGQIGSLFKLSKNGSELATANALEFSGAILPDPGDHFAKAMEVIANLD